jgi:hypothetical protein
MIGYPGPVRSRSTIVVLRRRETTPLSAALTHSTLGGPLC